MTFTTDCDCELRHDPTSPVIFAVRVQQLSALNLKIQVSVVTRKKPTEVEIEHARDH